MLPYLAMPIRDHIRVMKRLRCPSMDIRYRSLRDDLNIVPERTSCTLAART
ncbi:MAG: hypothetical protein OXI87_09440 [Albidovulum sp.]|nr:hypothetical protein [Albidovulum sp.]